MLLTPRCAMEAPEQSDSVFGWYPAQAMHELSAASKRFAIARLDDAVVMHEVPFVEQVVFDPISLSFSQALTSRQACYEVRQYKVLADHCVPFQVKERQVDTVPADAIVKCDEVIDLFDKCRKRVDILFVKAPSWVMRFEMLDQRIGQIKRYTPRPRPRYRPQQQSRTASVMVDSLAHDARLEHEAQTQVTHYKAARRKNAAIDVVGSFQQRCHRIAQRPVQEPPCPSRR